MVITTQDNSILSLANFDALELIYKPSYNTSVYIVSAIIFDEDGHVAVEKPVCQFGSKTEAGTYLEKVAKDTSYITLAKEADPTKQKSGMLLNLARFNTLELVVSDAPPARIAGKMMTTETVQSGKTQATVRAIRYDTFGAVQKTIAYTEKFNSKQEAVAWFEQLAEGRKP